MIASNFDNSDEVVRYKVSWTSLWIKMFAHGIRVGARGMLCK